MGRSAFSHHESSQASTDYYNLCLFAVYLLLITLGMSIFSTSKTSVRLLEVKCLCVGRDFGFSGQVGIKAKTTSTRELGIFVDLQIHECPI